MKHISILILYFLCSISIYSQDTFSLKSGEIINASILEKTRTSTKYKLNGQTSGDTIGSTKLSKVSTIHYGNGEVDLLSSQNPRSKFPLGIDVGLTFRDYMLFVMSSVNYLVTPNLSAEIDITYVPFTSYHRYLFSFGGKYWLANRYSKSSFSPYVGLFYTNFLVENYEYVAENKPRWVNYNFMDIPLGISYITKFGLQTSIQLNNSYNFEYHRIRMINGIELRVGWRFKTGKKGY